MNDSLRTAFDALIHGTALRRLDERSFLHVTGFDATRWLNGMVTNSVQALVPGEGCYSFLLNAQGRILGDCTVYREPGSDEPAFLLTTDGAQVEAIHRHLDHFIIMDDVELTPAPSEETGLLVIGPKAPELLGAAGLPAPGSLRMEQTNAADGSVLVLTPFATATPQFELHAGPGTIEGIRTALLAAGAREASAEALEAFRILEARPLYGRDITERYLPQETNQPQALHFNKGCYLGQEIVERIRSRGQVHRLFTPLTLTGEPPHELPAALEADGKPVGEITSAARVPLPGGEQTLALGYVRREALDTHQPLTYNGGTAVPRNAGKSTSSHPHPIS